MITILLTSFIFLYSNYVYAETEYYTTNDGKVKFAYDEEQKRVNDYNSTQSTGTISNKYSKPSADEIALSTSCRSGKDFRVMLNPEKERMLEVIIKEVSRYNALKEIKDPLVIGDNDEMKDSKGRIGIFKKQYLKP